MTKCAIGTLIQMKSPTTLASLDCSHVLNQADDADMYGHKIGLVVNTFDDYHDIYFPSNSRLVRAIQADQFDVIGDAFDNIERN